MRGETLVRQEGLVCWGRTTRTRAHDRHQRAMTIDLPTNLAIRRRLTYRASVLNDDIMIAYMLPATTACTCVLTFHSMRKTHWNLDET